uniref:Uncharacterized protein n=1 Tax=Arundo donax TaxID=35708 RepID=A0A0A8ZWX4_ARUDO
MLMYFRRSDTRNVLKRYFFMTPFNLIELQ